MKHDVRAIMLAVLLALTPGLILSAYYFGLGVLSNILLCAGAGLLSEAAALSARGKPIRQNLLDGSALVTALLLGASLPPLLPWHIPVVAAAFALLLGKHAYGGLGQNPFNPAMVGYVVALIAFPAEMARWPSTASGMPDIAITWQLITQAGPSLDGFTGATALDAFHQRGALTPSELQRSSPAFGTWGGAGFEWLNLAYLAGGMLLLRLRYVSWHAPLAMLSALGFWAVLFYRGDSSASLGSPLMHWLSGGTMLTAWFIVTDPVSGAGSRRGQLYFGALVGSLIFLVRAFGAHPDGAAFAVLIANTAVPLLDRWAQRPARRTAP